MLIIDILRLHILHGQRQESELDWFEFVAILVGYRQHIIEHALQ